MPSVNEELIESAFIAELRRKGATDAMVAEIQRIIREEVLPDIAERLNRLPFDRLTAGDVRLIQLRDEINRAMGWGRVTDELRSGVTLTAGAEAQASVAELLDSLPFTWEAFLPNPDLLMAAVFDKPFQGKLMGEWFAELEAAAQNNIYEAFRIGMIEGKSIKDMAKDLLVRAYDAFSGGGVNRVFNNAEAVARTAANYASTQARLIFAEANANIVKGVEYVATLDDRTTLICMSLHGTVYPVDDIGPIPPQHYACRSTVAYVTKSFEEMGIDAREVQFKQRYRREDAARMDGIVARPPDFDTWLKTQPASVQDRLLGPVRAELWRTGQVGSISGFVDIDGSAATLESLGFNRAGVPLEDTYQVITKAGNVGYRSLTG